ncbi:MAG TPA: FtsX-like permease family protein [Terriglobia bacterium]|nr:FtsX-like permease family protein [Terriglobia bacterium]
MGNKMILANILHRPIRTAVSVLAVAIEVTMVMLVVGLTRGLLDDAARRTQGIGADIMVQPPNASFMFGLSSAPMSIKFGDLLLQIPHVLSVAPVLFQSNTLSGSGGLGVIFGIDMESWNRVSGGFVYLEGGPFQGPDDVLVDDWYAKANHVKVGQTLNLLNRDFHVSGIVLHGKGSRLFIPLKTAQDLSESRDKASIFFVKCTEPGYTDDTVSLIRRKLPGYSIHSITDYMSQMTSNNLPALNEFVMVLVAVAVCIGFLVIFLSMYTTITERTREIGILKSLGASKQYVLAIILREAGFLCAAGIVAGYGGSLLARKFINVSFPTLYVELTLGWAAKAAALALLGALLGSFYPAFRAAQLDPIDALAYE